MQANLIYNPNSGGIGEVTAEELIEAMKAAGFHPVYQATTREEDLDPLLAKVEGLVIAIGGDGTVRAVATRLIGKGVPLVIIPAGTANNIWRTFSSQTIDPFEIIAGLKDPDRRYFDVGSVHSIWGQDYFLEAFGFGRYADILYYYEPDKGKSVLRSISALVQTLTNQAARICRVNLDGEDLSGEYLLFEALNTTAMGPRMKLAPQADPGDGRFEVVRISEDNRESLLAYLNGLLTETLDELPSVEVSQGCRLVIFCDQTFPFHVDAEVRPKREGPEGEEAGHFDFPGTIEPIIVEVLPQAIEFWLPKVDGERRTIDNDSQGTGRNQADDGNR